MSFFRQKISPHFKTFLSKMMQGWGLAVRVIFSFIVALILLVTVRYADFDTRLTLRGPQKVGDEIVLVELTRSDIALMNGISEANAQSTGNMMWSLKEIVESSDSFFWHPLYWQKALSYVLNSGAKAAVVTLFFGEDIVKGSLNESERKLFENPQIFWTAQSDFEGRAIPSGLASPTSPNTGTLDLRPDPDGKIRHFLTTSNSFPHISVRVENFLNGLSSTATEFSHLGQAINFMGPAGTFKSYYFSDLIKGNLKPEIFKDKIVIFSTRDIQLHQMQTPVGPMSSGELLAELIYSFSHHKWIQPVPFALNVIYLLVILIFSVWIVFEYPQTAALVFLGCETVLLLALSAALFDLSNIWLPALAPTGLIIAIYGAISSYRLGKTERSSWESERELHYLSEVESLKNNFLSLISHDLKTPVAKIQGITDRLMTNRAEPLTESLKQDLAGIRKTSEELFNYIASILQLTRIEAKHIKLSIEACDINALITDVIERVAPMAAEKKIEIKQNLEPIFGIEVDRSLISEVVLNLVENAIKYTASGDHIEVVTKEIDNIVRVSVTDTGPGIPATEIKNVFKKFYRGSGDATIKTTGTGLGLYLVKYFIELHGGKVFIRSQLGHGTEVGFTLPIALSPSGD